MDMADIQPVWGFGERIPIRQWVSRAYDPSHDVDDATDQAWTRLKRRLRLHGLKLSTPDPRIKGSDIGGAPSLEMDHGDGVWFSLDNTPRNRQVAYDLLKALDDDLLSVDEARWKQKEKEYKRYLEAKASGRR
jgi:hypothetical protein